jgi:hypothetical protein
MNGSMSMIKALVDQLNDAKLDGKTGKFWKKLSPTNAK